VVGAAELCGDGLRAADMTNATIGPWSLHAGGLPAGTVLASDPTMIRSELVARVVQQNPHLTGEEAEAVVRAVLGRIGDALAAGDRVELRDFGTFCVRSSEPRTGRNPRTGKQVAVPARAHVQFKPGKRMQARLNLKRADPEPEAEVLRLLRAS
jgi:integration host factor subunit beta